MGSWFSTDNTNNNKHDNYDLSTLNLSPDEKGLLNSLIDGQKGGKNIKNDENRYLKYDIFKILAEMEASDGELNGGGADGFSDTMTNNEELIQKINEAVNKKRKMNGGCSCEAGKNNCKCDMNGGVPINEIKAVRELVKNEVQQTGGKKNKKHSSSSSSSSTSSVSSDSSSSVTSSSSSKTPLSASIGGSDDAGISIFPFNSTTNSVSEKNFRLLRRHL
jgi:hypothetical protein